MFSLEGEVDILLDFKAAKMLKLTTDNQWQEGKSQKVLQPE